MPNKPKALTKSQHKGFVKGDLVWLAGIESLSDNVYQVEDVVHRTLGTCSSLLKLRLLFRVFYSHERLDGFHHYDETHCVLLDEAHLDTMKAKYAAVIKEVYAFYARNKNEEKDASTASPSKPVRKRRSVEPKGNKSPSN